MINNDHNVKCPDYLCNVSRNIPSGHYIVTIAMPVYDEPFHMTQAFASRLMAWTKSNNKFQYMTLTSMRVKRCPD